MDNMNFKPIFDYIDETKKGIIAEITKDMVTRADIARLENTVNSFAKKELARDQEEIVQKAKTERIEHWVMKAAEKIDVPYRP